VGIPSATMSPRKRYSFWLDLELDAALKVLKARDGMLEAEACRRALAEFLTKKGVLPGEKSDRSRAQTRKRP
jgi:hypothetical protein